MHFKPLISSLERDSDISRRRGAMEEIRRNEPGDAGRICSEPVSSLAVLSLQKRNVGIWPLLSRTVLTR